MKAPTFPSGLPPGRRADATAGAAPEPSAPPAATPGWVPLAGVLALLIFTAIGGTAAYSISLNVAVMGLRQSAERRLDGLAGSLAATLARFEKLPALLETTPAVMHLLADPSDPARREQANQALARVNAIAGADMLFVLEPGGNSVAAADRDRPETTLGHNYTYRPYFKQAIAQGRGRFFGIGITSNKPGYFLSYALRSGQRTLGVATAKVDLDPAERSWTGDGGDMLVSDERGVVILSSRADWKLRALRRLTDTERGEVAEERPYGADPELLAWARNAQPLHSGQQLAIDGRDVLLTLRPLPAQGWTMMSLDDLGPAQARARNQALLAALVAAVLGLVIVAAWLSRRAGMQKLQAQAELQAAHDTLEVRVAERTQQLSDANTSLAAEIESRKAVEQDLRATQNELVHAAKMAALGQISAGLAHELNQPLAAMRTLSDNAAVLIDKQRLPETRANLERISSMVGRLGELTRRLKTFAHKPSGRPEPTPLAPAVANAQALLADRMRRLGAVLDVAIEPRSLQVMADGTMAEQVLVNLLVNALDALAGVEQPRIELRARRAGALVEVTVADNGPGIAPAMLPRLFEAFATTKPAGAGLGMGLMISRRIVRTHGGDITAANRPEGGAVFRVTWTAADDEGTAA